MKVTELVSEVMAYGWSPEELHFQHPYLTMGQIHSALAYYWDHAEELDREIEQSLRRVDQFRRSAGPSPLRVRLKARLMELRGMETRATVWRRSAMMKLKVVLEPSDEGGYTVTVPALPGCISEGDTREDALENIREAIELYLEPVEDEIRFSPDAEVLEIAV